MSDRSRGYALRLEVAAPAERLWRSLVDPALLTEWCATDARVVPRSGGSYKLRLFPEREREARIDVFQPPSRLRLIYMPCEDMPSPDGVLVDDFILDARGDFTHLCLLGSGFPRAAQHAEFFREIRDGWTRALARLKIISERHAMSAAS